MPRDLGGIDASGASRQCATAVVAGQPGHHETNTRDHEQD